MRRTPSRSSSRRRGKHRESDELPRHALFPINATRVAGSPAGVLATPRSIKSIASAKSKAMNNMQSYSAITDNPFFGEDNEFELMHIKITVFGLSGILIQNNKDKGDAGGLSKKGSQCTSTAGHTAGISSGSTITSCEGAFGQSEYDERPKDPVYAVVTHKRNVSNSATSIASHLPSMPIGAAVASFGKTYRHAAAWPASTAPLIIDEDDECSLVDQSSFILERVLMREPYDRQRDAGTASTCNFVNETVDLAINLKRGSEMIPLGISSLVISGDEDGPIKMNLPAKEVLFKGKKVVVSDAAGTRKEGRKTKKKKEGKQKHRRLFSRTREKPCFRDDKTKEYSLDENATLKISLQVISHTSFKETKVAKARHAFKEQRRLEKMAHERAQDENSMHNYQSRLQSQLNEMNLNTPRSIADSSAIKLKSPTDDMGVRKYMCSPMMCMGDEKTTKSGQTSDSGNGDFSLNKFTMDSYMRERGIYDYSSVYSSVSESVSESEDEHDLRLLDTEVMVRNRTYD